MGDAARRLSSPCGTLPRASRVARTYVGARWYGAGGHVGVAAAAHSPTGHAERPPAQRTRKVQQVRRRIHLFGVSRSDAESATIPYVLRQRALVATLGALWLGVAGYALRTAVSLAPGVGRWTDSLGYLFPPLLATVVCALAARGPLRRPLWALAAGTCGWTIATASWRLGATGLWPAQFSTGWNDLYLGSYLGALAAVILLVRSLIGDAGGEWLDGTIAGLAIAGAGAATIYEPLVERAHGSAGRVVVAAIYPAADLVMLALVAGGIVLTRAKPVGIWVALAAAFLSWSLGDVVYVLRVLGGTYRIGTTLDLTWSVGFALLGSAAALGSRAPAPNAAARTRLRLFLPGISGAISIAVLVADDVVRVGTLAIALAGSSLLVLLVRLVLTVRLSHRLADSHRQAHTDSVTGLANRRQLMLDLERATSPGAAPSLFVMADLDEFKRYNDTYGHPAGDLLLARLASALAEALAESGCAYRLGGDEFCALVSFRQGVPRRAVELVVGALREQTPGFGVGCSYGAVALPAEANDVATALQLVDERMYAQKRLRRSTSEQACDLLLQVLAEQQSDLDAHSREVSSLAGSVAARLGMTPEEIARVSAAAELHDVGKLAIPERILRKQDALDADEWEQIRRHTLTGERILAAAPALEAVAPLVRSSHERWDGLGYPDGLSAEEIPLGARIVAVCDAYDAMTTDRPYRRAIPPEAALSELRACGGSQFDPDVVDAFVAEVTETQRVVRRRFASIPSPAEPAPLGPVRALERILASLQLASRGAPAADVFQAFAEGIAAAVDIRTVVVNLYQPESNQFVVISVVGDERVHDSLLGSVYPRTVWDPVLVERFHRRGAYILLAGEYDWSQTEGDRYVPEWQPSEDPEAWHPEDELFLPFRDVDGHLLGVFSLGDPASGRRPEDDELELLATLASHASRAYEHVCAHQSEHAPRPRIAA